VLGLRRAAAVRGCPADVVEDGVVDPLLAGRVDMVLFGEGELEPFLVEVGRRAGEAFDVVAGRGDEQRRPFLVTTIEQRTAAAFQTAP
jgi:hypothetical protein